MIYFCLYFYKNNSIDKVVFSTDLQDEAFYQNVQEGFGILFVERRMDIKMEYFFFFFFKYAISVNIFSFFGHNSLFLENKTESKTAPTVFLVNLIFN